MNVEPWWKSRTTWRDRLAWRLANLSLRIATPWYRNMIGGAIQYGLIAAARDEEAAR